MLLAREHRQHRAIGERAIGHVINMGLQLLLQHTRYRLAVSLVHLDELVGNRTLISEWPRRPTDLKIERNGQPFIARTAQFHSMPDIIDSYVPVVPIGPSPVNTSAR